MRYLLLAAPILLMISYSTAVIDPVLLPRMLAWLVVVIIGLFIMFRSKPSSKGATSFAIPRLLTLAFLAYLVYTAVTIPMGINPAEAIFDVSRTALVFLSFILIAFLLQKVVDGKKMLAIGILIAGFIAQTYGAMQLFEWLGDPDAGSRDFGLISSILANKNLFASFILFSMPFAGWLLLKKSIKPIIPSVYLALSVFNILALQTRAAWLALGVAAVTCGVLLLAGPGVKRTISAWKNMGSAKIYSPVLILLAGGMFIGMITLRSELREDAYQRTAFVIQNPSSDYVQLGSVGNRLQMWQYSLQMIKEDPILGKGPASWKFLLPAYGTIGKKTEQGTVHYARPHNDYLWILSENGIIGWLFYVLIFLAALMLALSMWFSKKEIDRSGILLMIFGVIAYMTVAAFSFPKERMLHQFLLVCMLAWITFEARQSGAGGFFSFGQSKVKQTGVLGLIVACGIMVVTVARINGEMQTKEILKLKAQNKNQAMAKKALSASNFFYSVDPSAKPIAAHLGDAYFRLKKYQEAEVSYQEAHRLHPNHLQVINNLGSCAEVLDRHDEAVGYYQHVLTLSPNFIDAVCNLSASYYNNGDFDLAYSTISSVDSDAPVSDKCSSHLGIILTKQLQLRKESADPATVERINQLLSNQKSMIDAYDDARSQGKDLLETL